MPVVLLSSMLLFLLVARYLVLSLPLETLAKKQMGNESLAMRYFPDTSAFCCVEMKRKLSNPTLRCFSFRPPNATLILWQAPWDRNCLAMWVGSKETILFWSYYGNPLHYGVLPITETVWRSMLFIFLKSKSFLLPPSVAFLARAGFRSRSCLWFQVAACQAGFFFSPHGWMIGLIQEF